jgi:hypothetical protein
VSDADEIKPAGSSVRFRVEDPSEGVGASWTLRTHRETGDTYVLHREGGRWIHTSFHHSGEWHFAVDPKGRDRLRPDASPFLGVSTERDEIAPGWHRAKRITVARSELRDASIDQAKAKQMVAIPTHPAYNAVSIDILLANANPSLIRLDLAFPVARLHRGDGGQVHVVAFPTNLDESVSDTFAEDLAQIRQDLRQQGWDGTTPVRAAIFGIDPEGFQREIEVVIDPD